MTTKITSANITQSGTSGISSVAWQAVQTTGFTAVAGRAYPCNTTSAAFTVTLPASPAAGNVITLTDYAGTWGTNALTINPNGNKINGDTSSAALSTNRGSVQFVYVDSTQGWVAYSGFAITTISQSTPTIDWAIIAGGGPGGSAGIFGGSSGGGAGGFRTGTSLAVQSGQTYTITVGGGGAGGTNNNGSPSSIAGPGITASPVSAPANTIQSAGGGTGLGGSNAGGQPQGSAGGSGGGAVYTETTTRFAGNTPSTTPSQGNDGGLGSGTSTNYGGGGGGGAGGQGGTATATTGGSGGNGSAVPSNLGGGTYAGGGAAGTYGGGTVGTAGSGGGGTAGAAGGNNNGGPGGTNTGGGGGGSSTASGTNTTGGSGGSGIVLIAYPDTYRAATTTGLAAGYPVVSGGYRLYRWNGNGSITF